MPNSPTPPTPVHLFTAGLFSQAQRWGESANIAQPEAKRRLFITKHRENIQMLIDEFQLGTISEAVGHRNKNNYGWLLTIDEEVEVLKTIYPCLLWESAQIAARRVIEQVTDKEFGRGEQHEPSDKLKRHPGRRSRSRA